MKRVNSSDLSNKPFPIIALRSALLYTTARHVCLILDIIGVIPTPV